MIDKKILNILTNIMIFVTPLIAYRYYTSFGIYLTLQRLLFILIVVCFIFQVLMRGQVHVPQVSVTLALIIFNGYILIRLLDTANFNLAFSRLLNVTINTLLIFIVVNILDNRNSIIKAIKIFLLASIIPIGIGLYQVINFYILGRIVYIPFYQFIKLRETSHPLFEAFYLSSSYVTSSTMRVSSVSGAPNFFGEYLGIILVILIPLINLNKFLFFKNKIFILVTGMSLLIMMWLLTFSRSAWWATIVGCLVTVYYVFNKKIKKFIKFTIIIVFVLFILFLILSQFINMNTLLFRFLSSFHEEDISGHLRMRLSAIELFLKKPLFGVGIGGYGLYVGQIDMSIAHSQFLLELCEGGIVGFIIFIIFIFYCLILPLIHQLRLWPKQDALYRAILIGLIGAIFLVIVNNIALYNTLYRETNWMLFALSIAASNIKINRFELRDNIYVT